VVVAAAAVIIAVDRIFFTSNAFDVFAWSGVIGTLILLVAYILATLGAMRMLWFRGRARAPQWQMVIPIGALAVLAATLYYSVDPDATKASRWNYYVSAIWVAAGVVLVLVLPGLARRVGDQLSRHEGLADNPSGD